MAWTSAAKVAAHTAILTLLAAGSTGQVEIRVYGGATLLGTFHINHSASSVSGTGVLTLSPVSETITYVASGTASSASLVARDGTVVRDNWPVQAGSSAVSDKLVLTSLTITSGGEARLLSASLG
jgi:hypothetical protein